ncbi:MAG TPA: RidA family protein [Dissulfurispiraceae bacterium]|nr:RidA family protein [Dissulfurispiraceae bacterium]
MILPDEKLKALGVELPVAAPPLGSYVPCVRTGSLLFLSGMLPLREGKLTRTGRVGESVTLPEAQEDARQVVINALAVLRSQIGGLSKVSRCIKLNGYVASSPDFTDQPKVLNAASDLLFEIFGEAGRHARAAVGVSVLPLNSPVEIDFVFEIAT